ncbi:unnamed protein product [Caenorhabditis nigoni]
MVVTGLPVPNGNHYAGEIAFFAKEPIVPSPTTSSNPHAVRNAPVRKDDLESMESTERMKSFSENATDMYSSLLTMMQNMANLKEKIVVFDWNLNQRSQN